MANSNSAERYRLRDAFHAICARVKTRVPQAALDRAVAYWALSADRRLPVALLDRSLREILETPFERLAATPGIGLKKMSMLNLLLRRAADQVGWPDGLEELEEDDPHREHGRSPVPVRTVTGSGTRVELAATIQEAGESIAAANLGGANTGGASAASVSAAHRQSGTVTGMATGPAVMNAMAVTGAAVAGAAVTGAAVAGAAVAGAAVAGAAVAGAAEASQGFAGLDARHSSLASPARFAPRTDVALAISEVDPEHVSESQWSQWRLTVRRNELEHETLGRFAPSLHGVPTVIWEARLGDYTPLSLVELRKRRTHGEKRVRVILEVFRGLHEVLGGSAAQGRWALRPLPRFIPPIESWLRWASRSALPVTWSDVRNGLVLPLINQVAVDAGPQIAKLMEARLGVEGVAETVLEQSRKLGLTRARIYQLLEMSAAIMAVRWPEGRGQFKMLANHSRRVFVDAESRRLFEACHGLCFPMGQDGRPVNRRSTPRGAAESVPNEPSPADTAREFSSENAAPAPDDTG